MATVQKTRSKKTRRSSTPILDKISTEAKPRAKTIIYYGPPGVGKTSIFAYAPNVLYLVHDREQGILDLKANGQVPKDVPVIPPVKDWDTFLATLHEVANNTLGYQWLILDSLTWFEHLCFSQCCNENYGGDWSNNGFYSYFVGPEASANDYWPQMIDALVDIQAAGINVVCLAHSQVKPYNNPDGPSYDMYVPHMDKRTWAKLHIWAEMILFSNFNIQTEKVGKKTKASGGDERIVYTAKDAAYEAKNRSGLPVMIDIGSSPEEGWRALSEAFGLSSTNEELLPRRKKERGATQ